MNLERFERYRSWLGPRTESFEIVFRRLAEQSKRGRAPIIVELGAPRSFVRGGETGVMSDDPTYWHPSDPSRWDWGAGIFGRVCAEIIEGTDAELHCVDPSSKAIHISKTMTQGIDARVMLHQTDSTSFLKQFSEKIDVLYMDHHETCEAGARLHRTDAELIVDRGLVSDGGLILVDDVHLPRSNIVEGLDRLARIITREVRHRDIHFGKGKYSIPYLTSHGFAIRYEGYQVVLDRISQN